MSDRSVSDLVFRDLEAEPATTPADSEEWQALLREELGKLRPSRSAPRVIPATDASGRRPSSAE